MKELDRFTRAVLATLFDGVARLLQILGHLTLDGVARVLLIAGLLALVRQIVAIVADTNPDYLAYSVIPVLLAMLYWMLRRAAGEKSQSQEDADDWGSLSYDFEITEEKGDNGHPFTVLRIQKDKGDDVHIIE